MNELKVYDVRCHKGDSGYLIDDGETAVLYDTGFGFTGKSLTENVKHILNGRKLNFVFLTHSHYDHVLGCPYVLREYPEAQVVAGRYAAEIFKRDGAKKIMKELDSKFAAACGVSEYEFLGDELKVDIPVDDGDVVMAGNMAFEVINLPGHTKCSIGFYCRERKLLLSSETLGIYNGEDIILPSYLVSYASAIKSIERVLKLDIKQILVPHCGILDEKHTQFFLSHMRSAAENSAELILHRIEEGESTAEIVEAFKNKYWHGYIKEIYPEDAINLNTTITIDLIRKELAG